MSLQIDCFSQMVDGKIFSICFWWLWNFFPELFMIFFFNQYLYVTPKRSVKKGFRKLRKYNCITVSYYYFVAGNYSGFDVKEPTSKSRGKAEVAASLKTRFCYKNLVMIGDGAVDADACPPADAFIGIWLKYFICICILCKRKIPFANNFFCLNVGSAGVTFEHLIAVL